VEDVCFVKAVALFSGGKDSLYALHLVEKQGVTVDNLLTLLPTLPWPSPHAKNIEALKLLAESMGKHLTIVDFQREGAFVEALKSLEVDALVAGDINVEAHLAELFGEIFGLGFKALITGVNLSCMGEEWLGFVISKETSVEFLSKIGSVDPLGENGEFHTLVLDCPLYAKPFKVKSVERKAAKGMTYLKVSIG